MKEQTYHRGKCPECGYSVRFLKPLWQRKLGTHYFFVGTERHWCKGSGTVCPKQEEKSENSA